MDASIIRSKDVIIEIYGLGYVGLPLAVKLASEGFEVQGIDTDEQKVQRLRDGRLSDFEESLRRNFEIAMEHGRLSVTANPVRHSKPAIAIICVPTPIPNGGIKSDKFVMLAAAKFLDHASNGDLIILESSIEIGTTEKIMQFIESKGYRIGDDFGIAYCPERIDPNNKKWNLDNIPRIIYCSDDQTFDSCRELYARINHTDLTRVSSAKAAEIVKSFENAFRLVNISLVNELAVLCDKQQIDVREIIDAAATKPYGFMPFYTGAGAGGHCIPKDPRFLLESAKKFDMRFQTLENALSINSMIPAYIAESIGDALAKSDLRRSVLVCGLSYKPNIEDMRDSPGFKIIKELENRKIHAAGYDPYYKREMESKYLIENGRTEPIEIRDDLDGRTLADYDCLCIVQHHIVSRSDMERIYSSSAVKLIYDCQGRLKYDPDSNSALKCFGR